MHSCDGINASSPAGVISMPACAPASSAPTANASVGSDVLTDWSVHLGLALSDTVAHGDFSNAYLYSAREDHAADLERQLDDLRASELRAESAPTPASTKDRTEAIDVITNALAAVAAEDLTVAELRAEIHRTEHAMTLLRAAAPLNGGSLRNDFLYESGLDDSTFAGALENFENDSPSYNKAMRSDDYKEWDASIDTEMDSLLRHETYEPIPEDTLQSWCPVRRFATEVVNTMYALKRKRDHLNRVSQYKARIVVMGNVQKGRCVVGCPARLFFAYLPPNHFQNPVCCRCDYRPPLPLLRCRECVPTGRAPRRAQSFRPPAAWTSNQTQRRPSRLVPQAAAVWAG